MSEEKKLETLRTLVFNRLEVAEAEVKIMHEINTYKKTRVDYFNGEWVYVCPNCNKVFIPADKCPECGHLVKSYEGLLVEHKYECECYDDFFTKWFEITEDYILNSLIRAELMGYLATIDVCKKGEIYIHLKEDDWCQTGTLCQKGMEKICKCEFFDDNTPIIKIITIK